jgi:glucose/arabinose dehydrogenase
MPRLNKSVFHRGRRALLLGVTALATIVVTVRTESTLPPGFVDEAVATGFALPVAFSELPDGRILVAEKAGVIRLVKDGELQAQPFLDLRSRVNDYWDRGLLGITTAPDFASTGFVYLYYVFENDPTDYAGGKTARLTRVTAVGDTATLESEVVILGTISGNGCGAVPVTADCIPANGPSHNGGGVRIGTDGSLYLTTGDAAGFSTVDEQALRVQNPDSLSGKLLRVTPAGTGVPTNRWWDGDGTSNRSKAFALGLRNPLRFGLRPVTDVPYIGDVGWNNSEEVNAGSGNFGWPCYEGDTQQPGYAALAECQSLYAEGASAVVAPIHAYPHDGSSMSVVGGAFYTGSSYPAAYQGAYFVGDYVLRYFHVDENDRPASGVLTFATSVDGPVDLQMGSDGNLYYAAIITGELRRIVYTGDVPATNYVSDLGWSTEINGWGPAERDRSNGEAFSGDGRTLTLNGVTYAKGLGVHAGADIRIPISATCTSFSSDIGIDDEVGDNGSVVFEVWADGSKLYDSGLMTGASPTAHVQAGAGGDRRWRRD